MLYTNYLKNHVVLPGREKDLDKFLKKGYGTIRRHKLQYRCNSNSEDALTWSCFDILKNLRGDKKIQVLNQIWEDAYQKEGNSLFSSNDKIEIKIGDTYIGATTKESTEVDASIELSRALVFFEAKLYSAVSMAKPPEQPYNQIARKLRIGLDNPLGYENYDFYFIFLDIAPRDKLVRRKSKKEAETPAKGFHDKWKNAWWFNYYKYGRNNSLKPLRDVLKDIYSKDIKQVANNMGWLTWTDLFKDLLRGMI